MNDPGIVRAVSLLGPLAAAAGLWLWRRPDRREAAAALLATLWTLPPLLLVHGVAARAGWWSLHAEGGLLLGFPLDLYLGWAVLWGAVPLLAFPRVHLVLVAAIFLLLDVTLMPYADPVVHLGPRWIAGDVAAIGLCLVPAQLLGRWTREDRRLSARAFLQVICFAGLTLGVLPTIILEQTGEGAFSLPVRPSWGSGLYLQMIALPAIVGLSAVQEFVTRGGGTPVPYDPPRLLVRSGPYAYVSNPMQLSLACVFAGCGLFLENPWIAIAGAMVLVYSSGLAAWDENRDLERRFGDAWTAYRRAVRRWIPRWRPWIALPARLYVAEGCGPCASVRQWIGRRRPIGLEVVAAEDHPSRDLSRITYEPGDGSREEEGVAALARAFEHLHLGWAFLGATVRLPVVRPLVQLLIDAVGGGPRLVKRRGTTESPTPVR